MLLLTLLRVASISVYGYVIGRKFLPLEALIALENVGEPSIMGECPLNDTENIDRLYIKS